MEDLIFVIYIGIARIRDVDITDYCQKIVAKISPNIKGQLISIPTNTIDTRIECINPKYITDKDLIDEHTQKLNALQNELNFQLEQLKKENE